MNTGLRATVRRNDASHERAGRDSGPSVFRRKQSPSNGRVEFMRKLEPPTKPLRISGACVLGELVRHSA